MIAPMQVVKGMPEPPNACTICGSNGVDGKGEPLDAIYAPGVDIDWGGSLYICLECAQVIADLIGRVPTEGFDALNTRHEALTAAHAELEEKYERQEALLDKVREGVKAQKEIKKAAVE